MFWWAIFINHDLVSDLIIVRVGMPGKALLKYISISVEETANQLQ